MNAGGSGEPPASELFQLVARAFGRGFRLGHPFPHLRFHCIKVEARASLHRRVLEEGLEFFPNDLLDEYKAPELDT